MSGDLTPVREEDAFAVESVHDWLLHYLPELVSLPQVEQFRRGASNLTYLLKYPDRELVLRRPPIGTKAASAHDMHREFVIQKNLMPVYPFVPKMIAFCDDTKILGSDFYVMERVQGTILRRDLPSELSLTAEEARALGNTVIDGLVQLHSVNSSILKELSKGPGYVARQVDGWSRRYRAARTDDVPEAESLMQWLRINQPADLASCVIHGDWRLDNMVLDFSAQPKLVGILDWELATVGDPLMDLGSAMAYWVEKDDEVEYVALRRQPSHLPGMPTRSEFVARYLEKSQFGPKDFTFYEVFGLFRLAVISQQIWARYRAGQTTNPSFAEFGSAVNILINRAERKTL